jgi:hypothetical protein
VRFALSQGISAPISPLFRHLEVPGSAKELRRKANTPPDRLGIGAIAKQNVTAKARMAAPLTVC